MGPRAGALLRFAIAVTIGVNAAFLAMATIQSAHHATYTDFEFYWRAVRLWADGIDPYGMRPGAWPGSWPLRDRLFYPLPALLIVWPLHFLTLRAAAGVFAGVSAAWLAWARTKEREWWRLLIFCTPHFVTAVTFGQWSPLLTIGVLVPSAGFLLTSKPTLGLAAFAFRPTWRGVLSMSVIGLVSLAIWPGWPVEWLENLRFVQHHPAPLAAPLGWLLLLALVRWRQPETRLLLAMACMPQHYAFADQLPLALVARNRLEAVCLSLGGFVSWLLWLFHSGGAPQIRPMTGYVMAGAYLPALWIVLRRPNEGNIPLWLERRTGWLPAWIRGQPPCESHPGASVHS